MKPTPRVALLVETARGYGRALLRGVVRYSRLHGPWSFHVTPGDFEQMLPRMKSWGGTGIIARIETPGVARAILASGLPTVALDLSEAELRAGHPLSGLSEICSDSRAAARLAAEHLIERGLRQFAFVGLRGRVWSDRREAGFVERLSESGLKARVYHQPASAAGRSRVIEQGAPGRLARSPAAPLRPHGLQRRSRPTGPGGLPRCRPPRAGRPGRDRRRRRRTAV